MILSIDPGLSGALAWVSNTGQLVMVHDMPVIEVAVGKTKIKRRRVSAGLLAGMLTELLRRFPVDGAVLEEVGTKPGEGAVGAFAFGRSFGSLEGVLAGLGVPYELVRPNVWKRALHLGPDKGAARQRAIQLFPSHATDFARVKDDGRAEAALLGHYRVRALPNHSA